ncbi:MAG: aminotransferase class V-fold PLP-dependent enzyme, partial [Planctomycetes bacterium]|nr:aminotransferase class V-fold PLP-dependent enzyme [Planctomycetota bacterium]
GVAHALKSKGNHIITASTEHHAVLNTCKFLEKEGYDTTYIGVDIDGIVDIDKLKEAITDKTILVSIMQANNETGTIAPVEEIAAIAKAKGVYFHTDAVQAAGKIPLDVSKSNIDLLSLSAHKVYGPKGVGALYVRRKDPRVRLRPIIFGGGHERGLRSGTLNVPGIVGCGLAAEIALKSMTAEGARSVALRDRLWDGISRNLPDIVLNGDPERGLPNTLNVSFRYVEGESLMTAMKEIAVSSGSACASAPLEPSYVLEAIGVKEDLSHGSLRFSLGRFTTEEDITYTIERVVETVRHLRKINPLYEMSQLGAGS